MSSIITRLGQVTGSDGTTYLLEVQSKGRMINPEAFPLLTQAMTTYLDQAAEQDASLTNKVIVVQQTGIQGSSYNDPQGWVQLASILSQFSAKPPKAVRIDALKVEDYQDDNVDATFGVDPAPPSSLPSLSFEATLPTKEELALELAQKLVAPEQFDYKKHRREYRGALLSLIPRENLSAQIIWEGNDCSTRMEFVRNNPFNGRCYQEGGQVHEVSRAITPALITKTKNFDGMIPLQRKMTVSVNGKESTAAYAGRVANAGQAEEMAKFLFLSEWEEQRRGITKTGDLPYEFQFAVQSLLSFGGGEDKMMKQEILAYEKLQGKRLTVVDSQGNEIEFAIKPVLICNTQMNLWQTLSLFLPNFVTRLDWEREITFRSDEQLFRLLKEKNGHISPGKYRAALNAFRLLFQNGLPSSGPATNKEPWQQILARVYIYHLLGIPVVAHCKSSTDRTGAILAMIAAMVIKLQIQYHEDHPPQNILDLVNDGAFKSLYMANLQLGLLVAMYSRGVSRFKIFVQNKLFKKWWTLYELPMVQDLLPSELLETRSLFGRRALKKSARKRLSPSTTE